MSIVSIYQIHKIAFHRSNFWYNNPSLLMLLETPVSTQLIIQELTKLS